MKKVIIGIVAALVVVVVVVVVVLLTAKNAIIKKVMEKGAQAVGVDLKVDSVNLGLLSSKLNIKGLKIANPSGFSGGFLTEIPEIHVDCNLGDMLENNFHFEEVKLDFKALTIEKNAKGEWNVNKLKEQIDAKTAQFKKAGAEPAEEAKPAESAEEAGPPMKFQIDKLELTLGKVAMKDYAAGATPDVKEYDIGIDHEVFENVTDPKEIGKIIMARVLKNQALSQLGIGSVEEMKEKAVEQIKGKALGKVPGAEGLQGKTAGEMKEEAPSKLKQKLMEKMQDKAVDKATGEDEEEKKEESTKDRLKGLF